MILDDAATRRLSRDGVEYDAFAHLDDVASATQRALVMDLGGHIRMLLCGPGAFDSGLAERTLGWNPKHGWPERTPTRAGSSVPLAG